ncbi:MAG TPA: CAP domain-containing protein [Puia sp.]|nr:CAP domain-containing protein [Puia sp.]
MFIYLQRRKDNMVPDRNNYVKKTSQFNHFKNRLYINENFQAMMVMIFYKLYLWMILYSENRPLSVDLRMDTMETEILQYVNDDRKQHNLQPLQMDAMESSLALKHSQDMASGKVKFGHDGFNSRAKALQKSLGATEVGENVAFGPMTAREVVDGWLNSPGHKKNIEGNFILTGIGYARDKKGDIYFTQIFSR